MMMGGGGDSPGNTNQFIGSKISLISKSEIRYEGILYSLDLEEATISLQKVRSFGTEDRQTARRVGPKDEVYEFIIFRGSDIKGIDVLEPPPASKDGEGERDEEPVDPAIVGVQHYQGQLQQPPPQQPAPIGPLASLNDHPHHQQLHHQQQQQNNFGSTYAGISSGLASSNLIGGAPPTTPPQQHPPQQFNIGVGFGGAGQQGMDAPPPMMMMQQQKEGSSPENKSREQRPQNNLSSSSSGGAPNQRRAYVPRGRGGGQQQQMMNVQQQQQRGGGGNAYGQRGRGFGTYGYNNAARYGQGGNNGIAGQAGGGHQQQSGGGQRNYFRRGELKGNKKLTFDGEFDFEKANEELQKALMKIKIADGEKEEEDVDAHHHEGESDGEEGGAEDGKENENSKNFYSKDNFFDSISCEALERKSGKREKPDWRAERKLNAETFGVPANRGRGGSTYYRGGYNNYNNHYHHGGYNNYSRGGGYGGGGYSRNNYHRGGGGGYRGGGGGGRGGGQRGVNTTATRGGLGREQPQQQRSNGD